MPAKSNEDLFSRAAAAAHLVTTLAADLKVTRDRLAKAKAEARSLKRQVWEALGGKPRKRKPRDTGYVYRCSGGDYHDANCGGTCGTLDEPPRRTRKAKATVPHASELPRAESNAPGPNHPICWFQGCGKLAVAAISDFEGVTWECCAEHRVASGNRDVLKENADA